ncbi:hypothetical protein RND71_011775 [Anisodus tanguticus]|uniref:Uncharacterized protein n=1 Tax=Anisodus tanguticus TaxID=243964 RepID=A0AAE1SEK6_9SOLA|nr:hypothetical protein RND71_011775 [Anisodus tanguticus]
MMSPKPLPENRGSSHPATMRQTPLQIIHIVGNFMRIWSVYSMYRYLSQTGASVVLFMFCCLLPSCIWFLVAQKPWKGRALSNTQVVPSVVNGAITALFFILWGKGLKSCGPVRNSGTKEYYLGYCMEGGGMFGKSNQLNKQIPFSNSSDDEAQTEQLVGMKEMLVPILAGILSALRRVIARRVSLKNQLKRRLHAITLTSATCFLFPVAMWDMIIEHLVSSAPGMFAYLILFFSLFFSSSPSSSSSSAASFLLNCFPSLCGDIQGSNNVELPFSAWAFSSTILFGMILIFYIDSIAEER